MSRVKITEYRAKKLILGDAYRGISVGRDAAKLPKSGRFVVKVDQGVKKRFKQGLVAVDVRPRAIPKIIAGWKKKGFSRFLVEPFLVHTPEEERYFSLERVRGGMRMLYGGAGGVDIEAHPENVRTFLVTGPGDVPLIAKRVGLPEAFLENVCSLFDLYFFAFLEINTLVVRGKQVFLLDAALLTDSAGMFFVNGAWGEEDIVEAKVRHPIEEAVRDLQKTTPASLKLTVMNPNGSIFFLLSGGGGSIVIADEAHLKGAGKEIGNYGEYSGGPTREEAHLYTREMLRLLLAARPPAGGKKALVIAGGVANFTDIKTTFAGIIDAFEEVGEKLRKAGVKVFVRRGGPNEEAGLAHMHAFLKGKGLLGSVHGSAAPITVAVDEAIDFVQK